MCRVLNNRSNLSGSDLITFKHNVVFIYIEGSGVLKALRREVVYQFNRPSPVCYLCSVNTAHPALAVSSYKLNPTESGSRRQMATPSRSNLTNRGST
jgi:hypothetical protein